MHRALIALGLILACITQALALAGQQRTVMMQPPGWVLQSQPVSMDWARGRYWAPGMGYTGPLVLTTTTRASTKYCQMLSGIWQTTNNNNYPAICDQGVLPEEARTNDALWSRNMTQAGSWTLVGDTVALNAVGIDGQANSASTLTATGTASSCTASCTALQSITLGSSADTYSVWLKRVTGSGVVNITINNLTGTTACTLVTTSFTRCTVTATLANPIIGIQMTTVGDVIVADFSQMEPGSFPTSPILTTSVAATRSADNIKLSNIAIANIKSAAGYSYGLQFISLQNPISTQTFMDMNDDSAGNRLLTFQSSGAGVMAYQDITATVATNPGNTSFTTGAVTTFARSVAIGSDQTTVNKGNTISSSVPAAIPNASITQAAFGSSLIAGAFSLYFNGYIQKFTEWTRPQTLPQLNGVQ